MTQRQLGFMLQPDGEFLGRCASVMALADYYAVVPETTWRAAGKSLVPNEFHRAWVALKRESGKPFVAHGLGPSLASSGPTEAARRRQWLARMRSDQRAFRYAWYTERLGATSFGGEVMGLTMPVPMTPHTAAQVRARLAEVAQVVPHVGVENTAVYYVVGDPLDEPAWIARILRSPRAHLLLDLHTLHAASLNLKFDAAEYLARLDLSRVIEIHVSGGSDSDPAWGPVRRLDSHDAAVPDEVWRLFERVLPLCSNLLGVTLERTAVRSGDVKQLKVEMKRIRRALA